MKKVIERLEEKRADFDVAEVKKYRKNVLKALGLFDGMDPLKWGLSPDEAQRFISLRVAASEPLANLHKHLLSLERR